MCTLCSLVNQQSAPQTQEVNERKTRQTARDRHTEGEIVSALSVFAQFSTGLILAHVLCRCSPLLGFNLTPCPQRLKGKKEAECLRTILYHDSRWGEAKSAEQKTKERPSNRRVKRCGRERGRYVVQVQKGNYFHSSSDMAFPTMTVVQLIIWQHVLFRTFWCRLSRTFPWKSFFKDPAEVQCLNLTKLQTVHYVPSQFSIDHREGKWGQEGK